MKKLLLGVAALLAISATSPVSAADMPMKAAPPPPIIPVYNWTGFYVGANGGWGTQPQLLEFRNPRWASYLLTAAVIAPEA